MLFILFIVDFIDNKYKIDDFTFNISETFRISENVIIFDLRNQT